VTESLDTALKAHVQSMLDREPLTEAALRGLLEAARAFILILHARLATAEARFAALAAEPTGSLADTATSFRALVEVRTDLEELVALFDDLEKRARIARASWLSSSAIA
jgi:hypothetical protein